MTTHDLVSRIAACPCDPCRALTALRNEAGSRLQIRATAPGRMCEMAVVAAAGAAGLTGEEVVAHRRAYQRHLGLVANGPLTDSPRPGHIQHAVKYSNSTPGIKASQQPIHLGRARAYMAGKRFFLTWEPGFVPTVACGQAPSDAPWQGMIGAPALVAIEVAWPTGPERIPVDLANLGPATEVRQTEQRYKASEEVHVYETTSTIEALPDGRYKLAIHYDAARNAHIDPADSWWGTTTLVLGPGDTHGTATWADDENSENDDEFRFRVVPAAPAADTELDREADEREIANRDLSPTDKQILIKARRGQGIFRAKVLQLEPRCRLTGTADPAHLRASHIKAWVDADDRERLDGNNGLMLAPHIDHLFDRALISFDDAGRLLWLNDHVHALLVAWGVDVYQRKMRASEFSEKQRRYLREHRVRFERHHTSINNP
jgi:hypothetical protein